MFLDDKYLLSNDFATTIYNKIKVFPIVDPHNHADVKALAANQPFKNLWQLFGATDHYVWEVMRKAGVDEKFISSKEVSDYDKFMKLGEVFPKIAPNPCYEWIHLDLKFLGINEILNKDSADRIYNLGLEFLQKEENLPLNILARLNMETMCSTDDPLDDLNEHESVNAKVGKILVRPTWRPDKAMKIFSKDWNSYIEKLGNKFLTPLDSLDKLLIVLKNTHDYFAAHNCKSSDHGLEYMVCATHDLKMAEKTFKKARKFKQLTQEEVDNFMSVLIFEFGKWNADKNWVTQLHLGAVRDVRTSLFNKLGADVGGDISYYHQDHLRGLLNFLNAFDDRLKVVLYCLDPIQQPTLATIGRAFGSKVRLGSAWWLCDTPIGMKRQLEYIGSVDLLSAFAGMVSDSRKLLSYGSRFEMFRRVLSDVLGNMVHLGQIPEDVAINLANDMAYYEVKKFFLD